MSIVWMTTLTGVALMLSGAFLGVRQIFAAPDQPNYPTVGPWSRFLMFWLSGFLIASGKLVFDLAFLPEPLIVDWVGLTAAVLLASHFANQLYNHMIQRASARTHRLIGRLHSMARCAPKDGVIAARTSAMKNSTGEPCPSASVVPEALLALSLDGVRVAAPNEGPEAFTGPWQ